MVSHISGGPWTSGAPRSLAKTSVRPGWQEADVPSAPVPVSELLSSGPASMLVKGRKTAVPFTYKAAFKIFALVISAHPDNDCVRKAGWLLTVPVHMRRE